MEFRSDRSYQVWDYHVSHSRLLIRSPVTPSISTNYDIIFHDVDFPNVPTSFRRLTLATVPRDEAERAGVPPAEFAHPTAFRLESEGRIYYIVALSCQIYENVLDHMDSSLQEPWVGRPREDIGRLLARS